MKKIIKKSLVFGAGVILLTVALFSPLSVGKNIITVEGSVSEETDKKENEVNKIDIDDNVDKPYKVVIGPPTSSKNRNIDEGEVIMNLSEKEALDLKERFLAVEDMDSISSEEIIDKKLGILREYEILPQSFTIENITKCVRDNGQEESDNILPVSVNKLEFGKTRINIGLHMFILGSVGSQMSYINIPLRTEALLKNISRLSDRWDIPPQLELFFGNITIFRYLAVIPGQIMLSGSANIYVSMGLLTATNSTFVFFGPFGGIYVPQVSVGIYVYNAMINETAPPPQNPILDIIVGFSLFSIQMYIEAQDY